MLAAALAFAALADPASTAARATGAALRALREEAGPLPPAAVGAAAVAGLVVAHRVRADGAGARAPVPAGALLVDLVLCVAAGSACGALASAARLPAVAPWRVPLASAVVAAVAGLTWSGPAGRAAFAVTALALLAVAFAVLAEGAGASPVPAGTLAPQAVHAPASAVLVAFPVALAVTTGIEALARPGRRGEPVRTQSRRVVLWPSLLVVGGAVPALAAEAAHPGGPGSGRTAPGTADVLLHLLAVLLLLAAAAASFRAGPGLLAALARHRGRGGRPAPRTTAALFLLAVTAMTLCAAGGRHQRLVLCLAVSVFLSFLAGLSALARLAAPGRQLPAAAGAVGTVAVAFVLAVDLARGAPALPLAAVLLAAGGLYALWLRGGATDN
ncbi:hypothetical protein AC230_21740 [Streptomyces caatingaensis]|uniref:Integral membrane protein n=1 Tax=Streptomyces caatingaensis TaxID=1678637 RepID=A0A0K9XBA0_9ACTN|nr:hypothetical protein AC230_21740 [Streptomyces caatingaensis]